MGVDGCERTWRWRSVGVDVSRRGEEGQEEIDGG